MFLSNISLRTLLVVGRIEENYYYTWKNKRAWYQSI